MNQCCNSHCYLICDHVVCFLSCEFLLAHHTATYQSGCCSNPVYATRCVIGACFLSDIPSCLLPCYLFPRAQLLPSVQFSHVDSDCADLHRAEVDRRSGTVQW